MNEPDKTRGPLPWPLLLFAVAVLCGLWIAAYLYLDIEDAVKLHRTISTLADNYPIQVALALIASQIVGMAFSLPTKALFTLLTGAILGPIWGVVATYIGVLFGTTALFYGARTLARDRVAKRFSKRTKALDDRFARRPLLAMAGLRLMVTLPYGPITLAASLTKIRYRDFIVGSAVGDLPVVVLYNSAGERLASMADPGEAVSVTTVLVLVATGLAILVGALWGERNKQG